MIDVADVATMPVAVHGLGSTASQLTAAGVWSGLLALIGYWLRSRVPMRRMQLDADEKYRDDLTDRVTKLEEKLETQRIHYEARLELERAQHTAELAIMRHRMNNLDQCLNAFFMLLEASPDKAAAHVAKIREMRGRQEAAEAAEKGAVSAARITAATPPASAVDTSSGPS